MDPWWPCTPDGSWRPAFYAELLGLRAERPEEVGPAWDAALASGRPCVIDSAGILWQPLERS